MTARQRPSERSRYCTRKRICSRLFGLPPGIEARMPISSGCAAVSQTLTVAHRSASAASAGRRGEREEQAEDEGEARHRRNQHGSSVMDAPLRRSTDVTSTLTLPLTAARSRQGLDFDALYRAARDDVFAYVATLLGDRSAAEDVTASAFERAYRRQRTYKAGARLRARLAVRHRPQRRARRAAPPQAQRRADRRPGGRRGRRARGRRRRRAPPRRACAARSPACRRASAS